MVCFQKPGITFYQTNLYRFTTPSLALIWHMVAKYGTIIMSTLIRLKPLMKEKNILSISDLIILQNILFVHNYFLFSQLFHFSLLWYNRSTIGSSIGKLPEIKTKFGNNSLVKSCVDSWNLFTRCLKCNLNDLSRSKLKYDISRYMINQYWFY